MILIALGANIDSPIGPPRVTFTAAIESLVKRGVRLKRQSRYYITPAWPDSADPPFTNAVAAIETDAPPSTLMGVLHEIERNYGRQRSVRNAPRPLDLDLLDYNGSVQAAGPVLPHPRLHERAFVLLPLADVAPDWRHPVSGRTIAELIANLPPEACSAIRVAET